MSDETKKKISIRLKGNKNGRGNKGKLFSEERKKAVSKRMTGRKLTKEQRKKWSEVKRGSKSHFWRGGVYPENKRIRHSIEYRLWRESVFERDNWTCIWCGKRSGNGKKVTLQADHIKSFAHYPELRFAIDNGRTLCVECHSTTENYKGNGLKKKNCVIT